MTLFEELKRRNVVRVGIAYGVVAWLVMQVADILLEAFEAPAWGMRMVLLLLALGLPVALFFAWAFELTPEGIKRESEVDRSTSITAKTGRKLDFVIIFVLLLAVGYFAVDKFVLRQVDPMQVADVSAVEATGGDPALPNDASIAVLPFENRSNREEDVFFTDGIHDDLLTQLAQIASLRVISRTSVTQFEGTSKSIREIAELLNVAHILEGGVQRAGDQVRINLQLIDAATDAHLWAATYDRELTANNIFAIQSEIASAVTSALRATLTEEEQQRIADVPTENMAALEEYFRGRAEMDTRTLPGIESARIRFQTARELDPDFALALAGEAQAILMLSDAPTSYGTLPVSESNGLARPLVERALALAPDDPQVLGVAGLLERADENLEGALDLFARSLKINPSSGEVRNWNRMALASAGRFEEAIEEGLRMIEADPMSMITLYNGIFTLAATGRADDDKIEELLQRLERLDLSYGLSARSGVVAMRGEVVESVRLGMLAHIEDPSRSSNRRSLAETLFSLGMPEAAVHVEPAMESEVLFYSDDFEAAAELARERLALQPDSVNDQFNLFHSLFMAGRLDEAWEAGLVLWERFSDAPGNIAFMLMRLSAVARKTEHVVQFQEFRRVAADSLQRQIETGSENSGRYWFEAALAAIDQRNDDAIAALTRAIDLGTRWQYFERSIVWDSLRDDPRFQAQVSRMRDLIAAERLEVIDLMCGPGPGLERWTPDVNTCGNYVPETATAAPT